jgi:cell division protein FtsI (penicillin-binding protein 3)
MNHSSALRNTSRRLTALTVAVFVMAGMFFWRMVDIQVVRAAELSEQSEVIRTVTQSVWAERGSIVDRYGDVLAHNIDRYDITISPRHVADFRRGGDTVTVNDALIDISLITGEPFDTLLTTAYQNPDSQFAYLVREVDTNQYRQIRALEIPWVYVERNQNRFYPFGATAGALTGMMGRDGPLEGIERKWEDCLAPEHGQVRYQRGLDGVRIPGTSETLSEAQDGGTVQLTIDSDLQWFVLQEIAKVTMNLGAESASAMVVEVDTGEILAVADYPTFDPNDFANTPQEHIRATAFTSAHEPGSTMKTMTIAALLDLGLTGPGERLVAPGIYDLGGGYSIKNSMGVGTRNLTTTGILSLSSNTGTAELSTRMSPRQFHTYFSRFGFGQPTSVGFLGEQAGFLAKPDTVDRITRVTQSFGQGMSATTAQVAGAYQAIANDGVRLPLTLVTGCQTPEGELISTPKPDPVRVVSAEAARTTIAMLETVPATGTLADRVSIPGYRVAAKTGTAEIAERGSYGSNRMISIAGMIPADNPQYVVVVSVVKPQTIRFSYAVAPAFEAIAGHVVKHYRVPLSDRAPELLPLRWG